MSINKPKTEWHYMRDRLVKRYNNKALGNFLAARIGKAIKKRDAHNDCLSHFRIAEESNYEEVQEYYEIKEDGCCGSYDGKLTFYERKRFLKIIPYTKKRVFLFGFNYGH
jgi:hypothetical protein